MDPKGLSSFEELKATGLLPSPKGVALQLINLMRDENVSRSAIVRTLMADPALCGRLIKVANRANLAGCRPVASVAAALTVLGLASVRSLALSFSLLSANRSGLCEGFDYSKFWTRSLNAGLAARSLAINLSLASPEEIFICGLLSRIGYLALATVFPQQYSEVLSKVSNEPGLSLLALERDRFGTDHNELTRELLLEWEIPRQLVEPVASHENAEDTNFPEGSRGYLLRNSLHLAHFMADLNLGEDLQRRSSLPDLFLLGARLGLESDVIIRVTDQVAVEWREWASLLALESKVVTPLASIAQCVPADDGTAVASPGLPQPGLQLRILVVEDDPVAAAKLEAMLKAAGHTVAVAPDGAEGLKLALDLQPQLLIADVNMPNMDGIELCRALRETAVGKRIYYLIMTAVEDEDRQVQAFEAGADDYLVKPVKPRMLTARLRAGQRVLRLQQEVESEYREIQRFSAELALKNRRLQHAAMVDPLTELPNRRYAVERLEKEWSAARDKGGRLSCLMLDVDRLQDVNDRYGHDVGDSLLRHVAQLLKRNMQGDNVACCMGGEEFLIICPNANVEVAHVLAQQLCRTLSETRFESGTLKLSLTVSVGVAGLAAGVANWEALMGCAERALHLAKRFGRNRCMVHPLNVGAPKRSQATIPSAI